MEKQANVSDNPLVCAHHFNLRDALSNENITNINRRYILVSGIAGGIAGISIDFALFPVDSIKTRLQVCYQLN